MCTAASYKTRDLYFGRTLDYDFSYGDEVTVMPRRFPLKYRHVEPMESHYAMVGMAHVADGFPLYYDAVNEKGLCIAGLNFVGNACYREATVDAESIAQFELVPWLLGQCASVAEAKDRLRQVSIVNTPFGEGLPTAQLHWLIADRNETVTVEQVQEGLFIYDNPAQVLTNNPPFPQQLFGLSNYMSLSPRDPENRFSETLPLERYSRGMGALGLPGDLSSSSRFVRATFVRANSRSGDTESESVSQFFHILGSVDQQRGCCAVGEDKYEITIYTSCMNADRGIYYYNTYENHQISAVDMHHADLDGQELSCFPLLLGERIFWQN